MRSSARVGQLRQLWLKHWNIEACTLSTRRCRFATNSATIVSRDFGEKIRNIGIIAHIDAGKTTTTERMLYYSGRTRRIGDVDEGSTVTDFLPAERTRGITIQSAAVTFHWPPSSHETSSSHGEESYSQVSHKINLIDTPGHADFTFEVLRSLRILDGAVCILDGVAGVEAQTEKVWSQANKYGIPRIIFVNKLDREGASFARTVKEVGLRLGGWPAVCQIPWWEGGKGRFTGIGDPIELCALRWNETGDGKGIRRFSLDELRNDEWLVSEIRTARNALVEALCEFDDQLLAKWLEHDDDAMTIPAKDIWDSLRRCVLEGSGHVIPIFAGASFRNIGVQPLLDAVNNLLPNPKERPQAEVSIGNSQCSLSDLLEGKFALTEPTQRHISKKKKSSTALVANIEACALAFKVVNDAKRGILVYVRVYSGSINRNAQLWNTNLHVTERAQRLLQMYAADALEIADISAGQIGVIAGLRHARTGDTLVSYTGLNPKTGPPIPINDLQLRSIDIPPPVFFAAIEPHSLSEEKNVQEILNILLREDPSLHVNVDEESGQMLISGMGELHLEIARGRLVNDFKAKATMGNIEIGYRECLVADIELHHAIFDREVAGKSGKAGCQASVSSCDAHEIKNEFSTKRDGNVISVHTSLDEVDSEGENPPLPDHLSLEILRTSLVDGAVAALARGPRRQFPLHGTYVALDFSTQTDLFGADTTPSAIASAARLAVNRALQSAHMEGKVALMEPVMKVVISCDESTLGSIIHDISSARGGHVLSLGDSIPADEDETLRKKIDPTKIYAPPDPFVSESNVLVGDGPGQQRHVTARVPLKEMVGYLKHLRSLTGGRGTFIMAIDAFERLSGPRERSI